MDHKDPQHTRLYLLAGFLAAVLLIYVGVLYDTQVNQYDDYVARSIRSIAQEEKVEASRGVITDRNGRALVSSRSTYSLTFDVSLLKDDDDQNEAILRLVELCQDNGVTWVDNLPISRQLPVTYTLDQLSGTYRKRFLSYLKSLAPAREALSAYLLRHPEAVAAEDAAPPEASSAEDGAPAPVLPEEEAEALLDRLTIENLTVRLLNSAGVTPSTLLEWMREDFGLPDGFSLSEARLVLGVRYELSLRALEITTIAYTFAEDIDTAFISLLSDGGYKGAKVSRSSVREYATTYAAHILGTVGRIDSSEELAALGPGYDWDDLVGKSGAEASFEEYLKGTDGRRVVSSNSEGKTTGEYYSTEPVPGSTVELTIDLELQQVVEDALGAAVTAMNDEDGLVSRGAAAAVVKVGTGEILSLASYPTYDLATYRRPEVYETLVSDPAKPFNNRATSYSYAPGSTLKPLTAVAALESGATDLTEKVRDTGRWIYPGTTNDGANCWIGYPGHGRLNVTQAITNSCNYFFAEMGYRMGMDTLRDYLTAFGLGEHTGIEVGDSAGTLPENKTGENLAPWAAFGQGNQQYTPLQLANYIATLVSGGKHCEAHLLKAVKSYDNAEVLATGNTAPVNVVDISESTLNAVKQGMYNYTQPGGMVYSAFKDCVVTAGAKTGTAQVDGQENNGVFVCFAPYDEPEIAVAIVIEQAGAGATAAPVAVEILNAYFSADETGSAVTGENQLLP